MRHSNINNKYDHIISRGGGREGEGIFLGPWGTAQLEKLELQRGRQGGWKWGIRELWEGGAGTSEHPALGAPWEEQESLAI